ncbi:unnamed protein product [Chrysoparadoxa australica]
MFRASGGKQRLYRGLSTAAQPGKRRRGGWLGLGMALSVGYEVGTGFRHTSSYHTQLADGIGMTLMRRLDPETAHNVSIKCTALGLAPSDHLPDDPILKTEAMGIEWPNAVGLAAGFDKHAEAVDGLIDTGFGFVEIGSVTPVEQPGNPKPRMFRLTEDRAVINRCGFNSDGIAPVKQRLAAREASTGGARRHGLLGVNVGKNKNVSEEDAAADYCRGIRELGQYADYLVVNVSSPNTPGLRDLQRREAIASLVKAAMKARDEVMERTGKRKLPLLVKIAPDLDAQQRKDLAAVALSSGLDGLIVSNTTISRPAWLTSEHKGEGGGLSGAPVKDMSTALVRDMYRLTKGKVPLIGVGGIANGQDAYDKVRAGASLVQVYSMMVYEGPGCPQRVKRELADLLKRDGFKHISRAVGSAA